MSDSAAPPSPKWLELPARRDPETLRAIGKKARKDVPRGAHAAWEPADAMRDPVAVLTANDGERLPQLLPVRYSRMSQSAFTFYRGAAALMAFDLAQTPISRIRVPLCGDCHLLNFGGFATPERNLVFDVNDFDEASDGPWEWDVKRLATSIAIAGRALGLRGSERDVATLACLREYREAIDRYAAMTTLAVWYARLDAKALAEAIRSAEVRRLAALAKGEGIKTASAHAYPGIVAGKDGTPHFVDTPPLIFHSDNGDDIASALANRALKAYSRTLEPDRRALFERFRLVDVAYKVVGVGSVGTRCLAALFVAGDDDRLVLQIKEANRSVLEPFAGASPLHSHGQRVVVGQRLLQFASDAFLGWMRADDHDFYVRQLRDFKTSANVDRMSAPELTAYATLCGSALARAHAKASGLSATIAGYLGRGDAFDRAVHAFAEAYAEQNARDYERLMAAIKSGAVAVEESKAH